MLAPPESSMKQTMFGGSHGRESAWCKGPGAEQTRHVGGGRRGGMAEDSGAMDVFRYHEMFGFVQA